MLFPFFGSGNFLFRNLLGFLGESMIQNDKIISIEKSEYSENVITMLHPDFPDVVSILKFFKKFIRNDIDLFNQIENKGNFLKLFTEVSQLN